MYMKKLNIGLANLVVSDLLKESYFNKESLLESKKKAFNLLDVVKNSLLLQLEFKVFNNIENKHILNETLAQRYIDNNIKLFDIYTLEELNEEHKKLQPFIKSDKNFDDGKVKLYESIGSLIEESLKVSEDVNVDKIHESFEIVLEHIQKPKENKVTLEENNQINEEVIELAINKFNKKYDKMSVDEVNLFKKLIDSDDNQKRDLFEEYKTNNIETLTTLKTENKSDKILKSLQKLNEMEFKSENADGDIIKLFELKRGLE